MLFCARNRRTQASPASGIEARTAESISNPDVMRATSVSRKLFVTTREGAPRVPAPAVSTIRHPSRSGGRLVRQAIDEVVHAELVRLVGLIEGAKAAPGPFPELRDVGVVVDDGHQPLAAVVVLEDALEDRRAADVGLRKMVEIVDL